MQKIKCKFTEFVLMPENAIARAYIDDVFETMDGIQCRLEFCMTCNNKDGVFNDSLDKDCLKYYGAHFDTIRSIWIARLGFVDDYWHLVKLIKL